MCQGKDAHILWEISDRRYIWKGFGFWSAGEEFFLIGGEFSLKFFSFVSFFNSNFQYSATTVWNKHKSIVFLKTILVLFPTPLVLTFYKLIF